MQSPAEQAPAGQSRQASPLADGQRQLRLQGPPQQAAQPVPRQRVLFLVRVIDRERQEECKEKEVTLRRLAGGLARHVLAAKWRTASKLAG